MGTKLNGEILNAQNSLARDFVVAFAVANLLNSALWPDETNQALEAMREFRRMNLPTFNREGDDFLKANHWLAQIRKTFNTLLITEVDFTVQMVACQPIS